ncbi:MAG: hypothetical protein II234_02715, partial [Clostridia bacterium]|nr:hypothetical protein [Clostridia bacterium]
VFSKLSDYISIFGKSWMVVLVIGVALYILGAFAIFKLSKKVELKAPFISFIPFLQSFALGRIAEKYIKKDGSNSARFSILLFIFSAFYSIFNVIVNIEDAIANDTKVTIDMFTSFIFVIALFFVLLVCAICYKIFFAIAIWRVFAIFDYKMATVYTIISVLFSTISPIFLFVIRNNTPEFDSKTRDGYFEIEQV